MIQIFNSRNRQEFWDKIPEKVLKRMEGIDDFVVRIGPGGYLLAFHGLDESQAFLYFDEDECDLYADSVMLYKHAMNINQDDSVQDMQMFFTDLTKTDLVHLQQLENDVSRLEEKLLTGNIPTSEGSKRILRYHKTIRRRKRYYQRLEFVTDELQNMDPRFSSLSRRFDRLYKTILRVDENLEQVREAYQSQIDIEQNQTMKVLTVVTTIVMPLTLIVGWYGMNLNMPEFHWHFGYPYVILLSLGTVALMLYIFKKNHWF
ncbi:MAG: CorA family divalent cation transporter [Eubacteriales bacterium]|nr:CorA family divalent cation transporter [Eubacteriales bacterium]